MINKTLINYIKALTENDTKTLSQQGLKLVEEVGELATVILPFENADSTTHRFVDREQLLEEIADVFLTNVSIAYGQGFSDEEIEHMIHQKSLKWNKLQTDQQRTYGNDIPYEIHLTVAGDKILFQTVCHQLGIKAIILDVQRNDGSSVFEDVMTSSVHQGTNQTAYKEMLRLSDELTNNGLQVTRQKIETVPWHPAAPSDAGDIMPPNCYFECHLNVTICNHELKELKKLIQIHHAHLSTNTRKAMGGIYSTRMVTLRVYDGIYDVFNQKVDMLYNVLNSRFEVEKKIIEFSLYDTKVSHDAGWITK